MWTDLLPARKVARLPVIPRPFYARPVVNVAEDLLGHVVVHGERAGRIVEVEAYLGLDDRAAHSWRGRTKRTEVMFGPPGHAYVYLIYGMYECLNVVAEPEGSPGCVLVRALEPVCGLEKMHLARPAARRPEELCNGPGRLTQAMGITRAHYGADLTRGALTIRQWPEPLQQAVERGPRIGVTHCADWPLRFYLRGNPHVSR